MKMIIIGILALAAVGTGIFFQLNNRKIEIKETPDSMPNAAQVTTSAANITPDSVPLPSEEDIIRVFFELINDKNIPAAIGMMDTKTVGDDSAKQTWGVQLASLRNISVKSIEPSIKESWSPSRHQYKVTLNLDVSESAASAPIPYYGWVKGENIRWITIEQNTMGTWRIAEIATGP